jgi:hypothetical protein
MALFTLTNNPMVFGTNGTERMRLDSSGNLGLGVTPSANQGQRSLNIGNYTGTYTAVTSGASGTGYGVIGYNVGFTSTTNSYKALGTDYMSWLNFDSGGFKFFQTGSVAAGSTQTGTQAMTLDSSGNLVVGATSGSGRINATFDNASIRLGYVNSTDRNINIRAATGYNTSITFTQEGVADRYTIGCKSGDGSFIFATGDSLAAGTERARIDSNGNLLVGGTSNAVGARAIIENASGNQVGIRYTGIATYYLNATSGGDLGFSKDGTERMRLDSSGNLLVGGTSAANVNANGGFYVNPNSLNTFTVTSHLSGASSGSPYAYFYYANADIGSITQTGTTGVLYNVTSDYRLKTVVGVVTGQGARIDALQPIEYTWNSNGSSTRGFLAHQFQEV